MGKFNALLSGAVMNTALALTLIFMTFSSLLALTPTPTWHPRPPSQPMSQETINFYVLVVVFFVICLVIIYLIRRIFKYDYREGSRRWVGNVGYE